MGWLLEEVRNLIVKNWLPIGLAFSFLALVFQMSGFVFPFWENYNGPIRIHYGLWQVCTVQADTECHDIQLAAPDLPGYASLYRKINLIL